ncbi:MAG TPA: hypothetical protein VND64_17235 [Pirellulales bacterium]|nr:hypothetical protein [Pirellulales bacterium]
MPTYPHAIRLRGPWDYEILSLPSPGGRVQGRDLTGDIAPAGRTTLPGDWGDILGRDFRGRVRYRRRFNRPSGLDSHERVWLVVEGADARASVALNGRRLGDVHGYALLADFDVTEWVESRNELTLEVELQDMEPGRSGLWRPGRELKPGGPLGEVRLEVRSSLFISELAVWAEAEPGAGRLHVSGRIGGETTWPSAAVVVGGCERELIYGEFRVDERFELADLVPELPRWPVNSGNQRSLPVEIKLVVGGASAWQTVRSTANPRIIWEPAMGCLVLGDTRVVWPVRVLDPPAREIDERRLREWLASLGLPFGAVVGLREILPDTSYGQFDAAGCPVVQFMPLAWAHEVCPRLAHHPSIVAWTAPAAEIAVADQEQLTRIGFGRPWIASETALG